MQKGQRFLERSMANSNSGSGRASSSAFMRVFHNWDIRAGVEGVSLDTVA